MAEFMNVEEIRAALLHELRKREAEGCSKRAPNGYLNQMRKTAPKSIRAKDFDQAIADEVVAGTIWHRNNRIGLV